MISTSIDLFFGSELMRMIQTGKTQDTVFELFILTLVLFKNNQELQKKNVTYKIALMAIIIYELLITN